VTNAPSKQWVRRKEQKWVCNIREDCNLQWCDVMRWGQVYSSQSFLGTCYLTFNAENCFEDVDSRSLWNADNILPSNIPSHPNRQWLVFFPEILKQPIQTFWCSYHASWGWKPQITSAMRSAREGLHSNSHRLGVMPFVLFWNFSGDSS
jgi:hypothetical protein